jgi:hypothetical protein
VGFLKKLLGGKREDKAEKPASAAVPPEIRSWTDALLQRLRPASIRFQPGETLGDVVARILNREEQSIRAGNDPPQLKELKFAALANLRQQFGVSASAAAKEDTVERPAEATYEMLMGGADDLKDVPITNLMQLVVGWGRVVEFVGKTRGLPQEWLHEYRRVGLTVDPGDKGQELVAWFRGSKEMIEVYREKLRESGLDAGPA